MGEERERERERVLYMYMDDNLDGILKITILHTHKGRPTFHYTNLRVGFEYK